MRASDVPIDDLRRKYQDDPGSLTLEELEALARYKKLVTAPAASTPAAVKSRGKPLTKKQKLAARRADARKKRETLASKFDRIMRRDFDLIEAKQDRGETLTASDRNAMQEYIARQTAGKSVVQKTEIVQISIEKALPMARRKAFDVLTRLLETSTRDDVRLNAAVKLKEWSDSEQPAEEPYTLAAANPGADKIVSINSAAG